MIRRLFDVTSWARLGAVTVMTAALTAAGAFSQETLGAQVPVVVNIDASVVIEPPDIGGTGDGGAVEANVQKTFNIELVKDGSSVLPRVQRTRAGAASVSYRRGNVTLSLPVEQYNDAVISLHSINGRRIFSNKAAASTGTLNISRANIPAGVYLLTVRGTNGHSFSTRLNHTGAAMNIDVAFANAGRSTLTKSADTDAGEYGEWTIRVSAEGRDTQSRTFYPVPGSNELQTFTFEVRGDVDPEIEAMTAHQLVALLGVGWNLGNTFDAHNENTANGLPAQSSTANPSLHVLNAETLPGIEVMWLGNLNRLTTLEIIQEIKNAGFTTIRIPVTWYKATDTPVAQASATSSFTINPLWMARIKQVVEWALDEGLYVILNTHHDERALMTGTTFDEGKAINFVTKIWTQVAAEFRDHGHKLIFEGLNEPREKGSTSEWSGGTPASRATLNRLNQTFVDVVRADAGLNNHYRILMVPPIAAGDNETALNGFTKPDDPLNGNVNKLILSVHSYAPFNWAHDGRGLYNAAAVAQIATSLDRIQTRAAALGMPVVLGEWGSRVNPVSGTGNETATVRADNRITHAEAYVRAARQRGMVPIVWDDHGNFQMINRANRTWTSAAVKDAIMAGKAEPFAHAQ